MIPLKSVVAPAVLLPIPWRLPVVETLLVPMWVESLWMTLTGDCWELRDYGRSTPAIYFSPRFQLPLQFAPVSSLQYMHLVLDWVSVDGFDSTTSSRGGVILHEASESQDWWPPALTVSIALSCYRSYNRYCLWVLQYCEIKRSGQDKQCRQLSRTCCNLVFLGFSNFLTHHFSVHGFSHLQDLQLQVNIDIYTYIRIRLACLVSCIWVSMNLSRTVFYIDLYTDILVSFSNEYLQRTCCNWS